MKRTFPLALAILLLAALACNFTPSQSDTNTAPTSSPFKDSNAPNTEDQVPRITVSDAKAALDSGQAVLVDVRNAEAYAERHATGAISISLDIFENNIGDISFAKEQWIITYCT